MAENKPPFPMEAEAQHNISMSVKCSFCGSEPGVRCKPGLIFPQYPHTDRLKDGLVLAGWTREEVEAAYEF